MKLKCRQDHFPEVKGGLLGIGHKPRTKIEGLTEGKTYEATPVSLSTGSVVGGIGDVETLIHFLVFNDLGEWENYQLNLFVPVD